MNKLWIRLSLAIAAVIGSLIIVPALVITFVNNIDDGNGADSLFLEVSETAIQTVGVVGLIGIIAGVIVSRVLSAPLETLASAAKEVAAGNLETRLKLSGSQEIEDVSRAFNQMTAALQTAERQRSTLLADVAHELRTPLTVLEGNLRAAIDNVYSLEEADLSTLYAQTQHLIGLVNDLHELSIAEANQLVLHRRSTQIEAVLQDAKEFFALLATEQSITVTVESDDKCPSIDLDTGRIHQVLHNILANAFKYTPEGGFIKMKATQSAPFEVQFEIQDSGTGIAEADLKDLFDRFYRVDKSRTRDTGGTGLGLAISKAIIQAHGGKLWAESKGLGLGTSFLFTLPIDNSIPSKVASVSQQKA